MANIPKKIQDHSWKLVAKPPMSTKIPPFLLPNIIPVTVAFAALPFNLQNRIIRTPESRRERVPKSLFFIVKYGVLGA